VGRQQRELQANCAAVMKDFQHVDPQRLACAHPYAGVVLQRAAWLKNATTRVYSRVSGPFAVRRLMRQTKSEVMP